MSSAFLITISEIRSSVGDIPSQLYTTDIGQEGHWYFDGVGALTEDNTGTILVTADLKRFKRVFDGTLNVKWFGAKGDGVTSDNVSIQKAIETAKSVNGNIYIPKGVYGISTTLNGRSGVSWLGEGKTNSIFKLLTPNIKMISNSALTGVTIDGICFIGTGKISTITGAGDNSEMLIYAGGGKDSIFKNCRFQDCAVALFPGDTSSNILITNNEFYNIVGLPGASEGYGVLCNGGSNKIAISNNVFTKIARHGVYFSSGSFNCSATDNIFSDCYGPVININARISDAQPVYNIDISNNVINGVTDLGSNLSQGISITGLVYNCNISNNVIKDTDMSGIRIDGSIGMSEGVIVSNNNLYNVSRLTGTPALSLNGNRMIISGNYVNPNVNAEGLHLYAGNSSLLSNNVVLMAPESPKTPLRIDLACINTTIQGFKYVGNNDIINDSPSTSGLYTDSLTGYNKVLGQQVVTGNIRIFGKNFLQLGNLTGTDPTTGFTAGTLWYNTTERTVKANINGGDRFAIFGLAQTGSPTTLVPNFIGEEFVSTNGKSTYKAYGLTASDWKLMASQQFGTTANRPNGVLFIGTEYFDTDLNRPVWWNGSAWVNSNPNATPITKGVVNQSAVSPDTAANAAGATPTQAEFNALLAELRDLKVKMRSAGLLA